MFASRRARAILGAVAAFGFCIAAAGCPKATETVKPSTGKTKDEMKAMTTKMDEEMKKRMGTGTDKGDKGDKGSDSKDSGASKDKGSK